MQETEFFNKLLDPQQFNLYGYVRNNSLHYVDPTGETLTVSGNIQAAIGYLCQIAGGSCGQMSYDKGTNTITVELEDTEYDYEMLHGEASQNEGIALLMNLVSSSKVYDLHVGTSVQTAGGIRRLEVTPQGVGDWLANLDANKDDRYQKRSIDQPRAGVDDQIAFNFDFRNVHNRVDPGLLAAPEYTIVFHELAEAFAKVDHKKQYAGAHAEAIGRETRLREQRPYLKKHHPGSGPGEGIDMTIKK